MLGDCTTPVVSESYSDVRHLLKGSKILQFATVRITRCLQAELKYPYVMAQQNRILEVIVMVTVTLPVFKIFKFTICLMYDMLL